MTTDRPDHPPIRTVIHLGAHKGERLQEYRDRGAAQIVLVEPEADLAADLEHRFAAQQGVRILAAAPGARDGRGELLVMSLPALNAMVAPAPALAGLYPGLRQERRQEVDILSPATLLREVDLETGPLLLVIETAGEEMAQLEAWKAAGVLDRVDLLELRCGEEPLYAGSTGRGGIEAWLAAEGFVLTHRDHSDPDWPVLHLRSNQDTRAAVRIAELEKTVAAQTATADRAATLDKTLAQLQGQIADLNEEAARDRHDLRAAQQDLSLALRVQARLEADLRDLQGRHAATLAEKAEQEALLRQLTPRLREAAQHLQALTLHEDGGAAASLTPPVAGKGQVTAP